MNFSYNENCIILFYEIIDPIYGGKITTLLISIYFFPPSGLGLGSYATMYNVHIYTYMDQLKMYFCTAINFFNLFKENFQCWLILRSKKFWVEKMTLIIFFFYNYSIAYPGRVYETTSYRPSRFLLWKYLFIKIKLKNLPIFDVGTYLGPNIRKIVRQRHEYHEWYLNGTIYSQNHHHTVVNPANRTDLVGYFFLFGFFLCLIRLLSLLGQCCAR